MDKVAKITAKAAESRINAAGHLKHGLISFEDWTRMMENIAEWEQDSIIDAVRD